MIYENALNIYTDGSSFSNPRRGGIALRFVTVNELGDEVIADDILTGHQGATNNEMELLACIKALECALKHGSLAKVEKVCIFTDSMYVATNASRAMFQWPKTSWKNSNGRPIENTQLWKDLIKLIKKIPKRVEFEWVKGHAKNIHNKAVDKLAKKSAKGVLNPALKPTTVRRKISKNSVQVGCVVMRGQTLKIRVITDTYLRTQKVYKYKYEVLLESGEFAGSVDLIYSTHCLRAGHHYEVRVNDTTKNPRIIEVLSEIERS